MKVLVTGGAGFIGSHLVKRLVHEGDDVTVLDNLSTGRVENLDHLDSANGLNFVRGDIRNQKLVEDCVKNQDRVIHLAAIASVPYSMKNPVETHDVNVDGTLKLLQACTRYNIDKMVYASSCAVYGEPRFVPVTEAHPFSATSPYAESKIESEAYCELYQQEHHLQTVCLRVFNVYGSNQCNSNYGGVITQFISRVNKQQRPMIYGDGEQSRDFIHVEDVAQTIAEIIRSPKGLSGTFNLGSGRATTINQLAMTIQRIIRNEEFRPEYAPTRPGDIRHSQADITKARKMLGFEPLTSLEQGLERLIASETNLAVAPLQHIGAPAKVGNAGKR